MMRRVRGVLLIAHGSRSTEALDACARLAADVAMRLGGPARVGYLELAAPDVAGAGAALVADGCAEIVLLPLLIAPGRHARSDLPPLADALARAHPSVRFVPAPPVGEDPGFPALVAAAAARAGGGA